MSGLNSTRGVLHRFLFHYIRNLLCFVLLSLLSPILCLCLRTTLSSPAFSPTNDVCPSSQHPPPEPQNERSGDPRLGLDVLRAGFVKPWRCSINFRIVLLVRWDAVLGVGLV